MKQKDKELLIKDLSARLPYGVICLLYANGTSITEELKIGGLEQFMLGSLEVKPYLRPMSSMTEEENNERKQLGILCAINSNHERIFDGFWNESVDTQLKALDWLNAHHFDYRGLIEKGLALEAPKDMYK